MSNIRITLLGEGSCCVEHAESGVKIQTDVPPEFGGRGRSFSSTDLLAAALGSCIASSLESAARNHHIELTGLRIRVEKELSSAPKRVAKLTVEIRIPQPLDPELKEKLRRIAQACPVHRSLSPEIKTEITLVSNSE